MRVVVPIEELRGLNSRLSNHFGRAPYYALIDLGSNEVKYLRNPREEGVKPGEFFSGLGIDYVVVKGGVGRRALELLRGAGVEVLTTDVSTLGEVIECLRRGSLRRFEGPACGGGFE